MRIKNKKTYWLKKKTTIEDEEGNMYADYSEPIEIKAIYIQLVESYKLKFMVRD